MAHLVHSPHFGKNAVLQRNADDKERLRVRMEKQSQQRRHDRHQIATDVDTTNARSRETRIASQSAPRRM